MAQIVNLKTQEYKILEEFNELLSQVSEVLGVNCKIEYLKPTQDGSRADLSISLALVSKDENGKHQVIGVHEMNWDKKCKKFGLDPSCLHKIYNIHIERIRKVVNCEVLGIWSMRKQRCPVVVKEVRTGKLWKLPVSHIDNSKEVTVYPWPTMK